ncbi:hypothetical protein [Segniliparus rugosus]|uniref:hypothetical protein n=1 Tax=Segniliparus rugosus TaxID=286804 RepID=UPI0012EBE077|nr:hypothetical protein [Segniliparus rugosus]
MKLSFLCSTALAGSLALGLAACDRGGSNSGSNGGGTTIIQTIVQPPGGAASSTPSVSPITDGKALCRQALIRVKELLKATDPYWNLVTKPGASLSDEQTSNAADHVTEVAAKVIPALEGMVGSGSPQNVANAVKDFTGSAKKFTKAIGDRAPDAEISPLASDYSDKIDEVNHACGY